MTREGLPRPEQQLLLFELLMMKKAFSITAKLVPLLIEHREHSGASSSSAKMITHALILCQRLMRHMLRRNPVTCLAAARHRDPTDNPDGYVKRLQDLMGYGIRAAETLREICA